GETVLDREVIETNLRRWTGRGGTTSIVIDDEGFRGENGGFLGGLTFGYRVTPEWMVTLGVTSRDVGLALRSAFFGVEAVREQRGRNELKVREQEAVRVKAMQIAEERMLDLLLPKSEKRPSAMGGESGLEVVEGGSEEGASTRNKLRQMLRAGKLDELLDDIAGNGTALTLGVHSRIDATAEHVAARLTNGNVYVNRNMIGAVVASQPFGGSGLSGTGPKAGGPHYLARFALEQVVTVNTAAAGGNAGLLSAED
ncbi:MAG: aldehyde dehydrogenase family protein, partial [Alphaproteobacteria bacterium]